MITGKILKKLCEKITDDDVIYVGLEEKNEEKNENYLTLLPLTDFEYKSLDEIDEVSDELQLGVDVNNNGQFNSYLHVVQNKMLILFPYLKDIKLKVIRNVEV